MLKLSLASLLVGLISLTYGLLQEGRLPFEFARIVFYLFLSISVLTFGIKYIAGSNDLKDP